MVQQLLILAGIPGPWSLHSAARNGSRLPQNLINRHALAPSGVPLTRKAGKPQAFERALGGWGPHAVEPARPGPRSPEGAGEVERRRARVAQAGPTGRVDAPWPSPGTNQRSRRGAGGVGEAEGGDPPGRRGSHCLLPETPPHAAAHPPSRGWLLRGCSSPVGQRAAVSPRSARSLRVSPRGRSCSPALRGAGERSGAGGKGLRTRGAASHTRRRGSGFGALRPLQEQVLYLFVGKRCSVLWT